MTNVTAAKSNLRVLGLGLSSYVATDEGQSSDTIKRLFEYGPYFTEYCSIVKAPNLPHIYHRLCLDNNVMVLPTLSNGNLMTVFRMTQLGCKVMKSTSFDVIVTQDPILTGIVGVLLREIFKVPLCISLHEDMLDNPQWLSAERRNRLLNLIGKAVTRHADFVRVVSRKQEKYVINTLKVPATRVMWAPIRIDLSIFEQANGTSIRSELNSRGFDRVMLFVGRLAAEKNVGFLLSAFASIVKHYPSVCLILVGDGPERERLSQFAASLNISDKVIFKGWLPPESVAVYMAASDLLLLSSIYEGFGRVILEAAATGTPTVSTICSGPCELIQDGVTGHLVANDDTEEMVLRVLFLLRNIGVSREMGLRARQLLQKEYIPERLTHLTVESLRRTAQLGLRKKSA